MKYVKTMNTKIGKISLIEEDSKIIEIRVNKKVENDITKKDTLDLKETE